MSSSTYNKEISMFTCRKLSLFCSLCALWGIIKWAVSSARQEKNRCKIQWILSVVYWHPFVYKKPIEKYVIDVFLREIQLCFEMQLFSLHVGTHIESEGFGSCTVRIFQGHSEWFVYYALRFEYELQYDVRCCIGEVCFFIWGGVPRAVFSM